MTDSDTALRDELRAAQARAERDHVPDFETIWTAATAQAGIVRRRQRLFVGSAAAAAVVAIAFGLLVSPEEEWRYIDADELLETTVWSAPSDSLLPDHQFDIYEDFPVLIESTETYGGPLL